MPRDIRKKPVSTPPPAATPDEAQAAQQHPFTPPPPGAPPFQPGELVQDNWTKQQLQALGWKEGDPLPGNMQDIFQTIRDDVETEMRTATPDLPDDFKPSIPDIIPIEQLPPERQREVLASLEWAKQAQQKHEQLQKRQEELQVPGASPDVQQALYESEAIREQQEAPQQPTAEQPGFVLEDDLEEAAQPQPQPQQQAQPQQQQPQPATAAADDDTPFDTGAKTQTECPKCKWPLHVTWTMEPTEADRRGWTAAVLGGTRFFKEIKLLGGRVRVLLRSLKASEERAVTTQLGYDLQQQRINSQGELLALHQEYRYALTIHAVYYNDVQRGGDGCELHELDWDKPKPNEPPATPLPSLADYINEQVLTDANLKRTVAAKVRQFHDMVEVLESQADDPNFF